VLFRSLADELTSPYEQFSDEAESQDATSSGQTTLDICVISGLVASSECKHTIKRTYESGYEPGEFCRGGHYRTKPAEPPMIDPVTRPDGEKRNKDDKPSGNGATSPNTSSSLRVPNNR